MTEMSYDSGRIRPIAPKHLWRILTDDELEKLEEATYPLLREVGVHFPLKRPWICSPSTAQISTLKTK